MALATEIRDGSPEWMRAVVKEHGSTKPLQLESRRAALSAKCTIMERNIINLQALKKASKVDFDKLIKDFEKSVKGDPSPEKIEQLRGLQFQAKQSEMQFDQAITNSTVQFCSIEGLCLIIDSLTIRVKVKSKSGKEGYKRFSVAGFLSDVGLDTQYIPGLFKMLKKHLYPLGGLPPEDDPESDKFEEEIAEDADVLTEEEQARIEAAKEEE